MKPQVKNFEVNYVDPASIASKICWTVFQSGEGNRTFNKQAGLTEGSQANLICGNTDQPRGRSGGVVQAFETPAYWVLADSGLGQITIYGGTSDQLAMAEEIVKNFDKREPQIYMEISIIELNESDNKELGFNHDFSSRGKNIMSLGSSGSVLTKIFGHPDALGDDIADAIEIGDEAEFFGIVGSGMRSNIEALIENNKGRVLANPRIIAANNVSSSVEISSEIVESSSTRYDEVTNTRSRSLNIGTGDSIRFNILPKVSPNGTIVLSLTDFSFDTVKESINFGEGDEKETATLKNIRNVDAKQVRVKNGDTFIIGGLIQEREMTTNNKVPILGDIPVIGALFNNQSTNKARSELIIMITPRVLQDEDEKQELVKL